MRGQPNTFRDNWNVHTVTTPAGELTFTMFPGPPSFFGCSRLDGVPIAPADAHRLLDQIGDDHGAMAYVGDARISVPSRQPM